MFQFWVNGHTFNGHYWLKIIYCDYFDTEKGNYHLRKRTFKLFENEWKYFYSVASQIWVFCCDSLKFGKFDLLYKCSFSHYENEKSYWRMVILFIIKVFARINVPLNVPFFPSITLYCYDSALVEASVRTRDTPIQGSIRFNFPRVRPEVLYDCCKEKNFHTVVCRATWSVRQPNAWYCSWYCGNTTRVVWFLFGFAISQTGNSDSNSL